MAALVQPSALSRQDPNSRQDLGWLALRFLGLKDSRSTAALSTCSDKLERCKLGRGADGRGGQKRSTWDRPQRKRPTPPKVWLENPKSFGASSVPPLLFHSKELSNKLFLVRPRPPQADMGRLHSNGKGLSGSALPYRRAPPKWLKTTPEEIVDSILKFARKGMTPSQIGIVLRDSHGVAQVRSVTGNKILRILKLNGLAPSLPEDLYALIKKAVSVRKHLERNRKDADAKFRLILVESRIHRLVRYYKTRQQLAPSFKYDSTSAQTLIG